MSEVSVPMDDQGMLSDIMSNQPVTEETPAPVEQQDEPARDESGRFVAKPKDEPKAETPEVQPETPEQPDKEDAAQVPSWRLREVREAREAAERRANEEAQQRYAVQAQLEQLQRELSQLKKPTQEPVNFFENPDQAFQQRMTPVEERMAQLETQVRLNSSKALAVAIHGKDAVMEMEQAIEKAMQSRNPEMQFLSQRMRNSDDPVNVAMQWYKTNRLVEATGGDPDAYRQKIADELLKDPTFQAKVLETARQQAGQKGASSTVVKLPPSLSKAGQAARPEAPEDDEVSDAALFRNAMRK